jgi:hypothetical protein
MRLINYIHIQMIVIFTQPEYLTLNSDFLQKNTDELTQSRIHR